MNAQLNHPIARQRRAELRRAGEQARLATEVAARRRRLRDPNPITRASTEPWRGRTALEFAARMSEPLADTVHVTVLDRNDASYFGFSKLDVLLGRRAPSDVLLHYGEIAKQGVEFRRDTVTAIDPLRRRVITDAGSYHADFLAVALGADDDMAPSRELAAEKEAFAATRQQLVRARRARGSRSGGNDHSDDSFAHCGGRLMETNEGTRTSLACDVTTYVLPDPCARSDVDLPLWSRSPRRKLTAAAHRADPARVRSLRSRAQQLTHEETRLNAC